MKKARLSIIMVALFSAMSAYAAKDIAKVNGRSITDKDMDIALSGFNEFQRQSILKDAQSKRQLIDSLVDQELIVIQAENDKLAETSEFKDAMAAFKKQYLSNLVIKKKVAPKVSEAAAKDYYNKNKMRFSTDQVHAQHILVPTIEKAKEILALAKAKDADFQALAEKHSADPSAKNNRGELGFFTRDRMVPEFTDAAFGAAEGDIVGPVKTSFGFHLIKVLEKRKGKPLEYHEVEMQVKGALQQKLIRDYVADLRKTAKIEVTP